MTDRPPLLPPVLRATIPPLYATEDQAETSVCAKLFTAWTTWSWFVTEFDGQDTCFGLVSGHEVELGYFNLAELEAIEGPGGPRIERDLHFEPQPLSKVRKDLMRLRGGPDGFTVHENSDEFNTKGSGSVAVDHHGLKPPSPIERPGIRLIETRLDTAGLAGGYKTVSNPSSAASILHHMIGEADCEHFAALFLNGRPRAEVAPILYIDRVCLEHELTRRACEQKRAVDCQDPKWSWNWPYNHHDDLGTIILRGTK